MGLTLHELSERLREDAEEDAASAGATDDDEGEPSEDEWDDINDALALLDDVSKLLNKLCNPALNHRLTPGLEKKILKVTENVNEYLDQWDLANIER